MPWKGDAGKGVDSHALWGYNPSGPILSPQQFAEIAADPRSAALVQRLGRLQEDRTKWPQPT